MIENKEPTITSKDKEKLLKCVASLNKILDTYSWFKWSGSSRITLIGKCKLLTSDLESHILQIPIQDDEPYEQLRIEF